MTPRGMTPQVTMGTGQTPIRTPVRDNLSINADDDMEDSAFTKYAQVK